jgi:hypothetical protein
MVMSVFGYMWGSARTKMSYNGFKFYQLENGNYMINVNGKNIIFNYYPGDLENINATKGLRNLFTGPMVYATSDINSTYAEAIAEVQFNLGRVLDEITGTYVQNAFTSKTEHNLPAVTCENASMVIPVIIFEKSNITQITAEGTCIIVEAKARQDIGVLYERILYSIIGVME